MEDGQVETVDNGQVETTPDAIVETPVIEQIGQLLNPDNQPAKAEETPETIVNEPQETIPTPETVEPKKEAIIDDAMVQQYPTLKMYLGKPLNDVPRAYHNLVLAYKKDHEELIKLKQEIAKKPQNPNDAPDPVESPKEWDKWVEKERERIKSEVLSDLQNQPQPIDWVLEVGKVLPQGSDARSVIDGFTKFNASRFYNQMGELRPDIERFYNEHPEVLLDEIKSFNSLYSNANKTQSTIAKEGKETAYKTITNSLKKAQENKDDLKGSQFNAVERSTQLSQEDEILAKIYLKAQGG